MKFKKVLCGMTVVALICSMVSAAAVAAENVQMGAVDKSYAAVGDRITNYDIIYTENPDGTLCLSFSYKRTYSFEAIIPATLNSKNITSINSEAFKDEKRVTFASIPDTVTSIGESAFYGCTDLSSIKLPSGITYISDYMLSGTALTDVTIPDSVTKIGYGAFKDCSKLTSVTIPNNVTSIGQYAFFNCDSLNSVTLPNSVTSVGNYAFVDCENLTSITIPTDVTSLGTYVFQNSGIKDIYFTGTKEQWDQIMDNSGWDGKINFSYPTIHFNTSQKTSTDYRFDLNGDGMLNIFDVITLLDYLSGN